MKALVTVLALMLAWAGAAAAAAGRTRGYRRRDNDSDRQLQDQNRANLCIQNPEAYKTDLLLTQTGNASQFTAADAAAMEAVVKNAYNDIANNDFCDPQYRNITTVVADRSTINTVSETANPSGEFQIRYIISGFCEGCLNNTRGVLFGGPIRSSIEPTSRRLMPTSSRARIEFTRSPRESIRRLNNYPARKKRSSKSKRNGANKIRQSSSSSSSSRSGNSGSRDSGSNNDNSGSNNNNNDNSGSNDASSPSTSSDSDGDSDSDPCSCDTGGPSEDDLIQAIGRELTSLNRVGINSFNVLSLDEAKEFTCSASNTRSFDSTFLVLLNDTATEGANLTSAAAEENLEVAFAASYNACTFSC